MNKRFQFRPRTLLLWTIPLGAVLAISLPMGRVWWQKRALELREAERGRSGEELIESRSSLLSNVERLISAGEYSRATRLVKAANPQTELERALNRGDRRYLAVAEDAIVLPGLPELMAEDQNYWSFPGTSDVIEDVDWQQAATEYAAAYNKLLAARLAGR